MIILKTKKEIADLREGGKILASVHSALVKHVKIGVSTKDLDNIAIELIKKAGGEPAF